MDRRQLDRLADRVEAVLAQHGAHGRVVNMREGPRTITFDVALVPAVRFKSVRRLDDDIALALGVEQLEIRRGRTVQIIFPNPEPRDVHTLDLLRRVERRPQQGAHRALLGLGANGLPYLVNLASPDVAHVLVAGTTGSGKSLLLQEMLLSLMQWNTPQQVQYLLIDPKQRTWPPFADAPGVIHTPLPAHEAGEALTATARLMEQRDAAQVSTPRLVVAIDELADVLMVADEAEEQLIRLLQRGRDAGITVIAATQRPSAAIMSGLMRANFPLRIVGKMVSADDAKVGAGVYGTGAENLLGRGDFLAVGVGEPIRFQAGYITDDLIRSSLPTRGRFHELVMLPDVDGEEAFEVDLPSRPVNKHRVQRDAARLQQMAQEHGRRWKSHMEAEEWVCGYNGGTAYARAEAAIAFLKDLEAQKEQKVSSTNSTTTLLGRLVGRNPAQTG
jgi:S-DNA-T family DNA segregation ATPase FtsK/SpoIIIE